MKSFLSTLALLALSGVASAQTTVCPATACVNVGDALVFTWTAPTQGPAPSGYNFLSGPNLTALQTLATANVTGPNLVSVGNVLTYTITATAAMIGTTTYAVEDWLCPTGTACSIAALSPTVTVQVSAPVVPLQPVPSLTVTKG